VRNSRWSSEFVQTGALATRLAVGRASVTEMMATFDDRGLVAYEPYRGAELTGRAYQIWFSLSTETVQAISEYIDQPCDGRCEATTRDECGLSVPTRSSDCD